MFERLRIDSDQGIVTVWLNRPEAKNAMDSQMCEELTRCFDGLSKDPDVKVILLRSVLDDVFSAGADFKERRTMDVNAVRQRRALARHAYEIISRCEHPVVAVVKGRAFGAGCELATACDFIVATEDARFSYPEVRWHTLGATQRLPRLVGKARAKELLLTGREISAADAEKYGLVQFLVAEKDLEATVADMAETIASFNPYVISQVLRVVDFGSELPFQSAAALEAQAVETILVGGDWELGVKSFIEESADRKGRRA